MVSFEIGDGHGIADNDWLLGTEVDSPDLNIAALTFAETRLRYLLFVLYILFGLNLLICLCLLCILYTFILNNCSLSCQVKAYEAQWCGGP